MQANRSYLLSAKKSVEDIKSLSGQEFDIVMESWSKLDQIESLFPTVVSTKKWISENVFNTVLRRLGHSREEATAYDFRVAASTISNKRELNPDVIKVVLAHQDINVIKCIYNRDSSMKN